MALKWGLSLTRAADDLTSADFQFAKDHTGPLFQSKETDTMFILTAQLRGYRTENIKIDINEDGTIITIGGEKPVEEMIIVRWKVYKKGIEIRKFRKAFRIPDGVILDNIKAKFNEDEYMLTISMPKKVKGIVGIGIEEMKEPELIRQDSETSPAAADKIPKRVTFKEEGVRDPKRKSIEERGFPASGESSSQVNGIESADSQFDQPEENQENQEKDSGMVKKALEEKDVADNQMTNNEDLQSVPSNGEQTVTHEIPHGDDKTSEAKSGKQETQQPIHETQKPECYQIGDQVESSGKQQNDQDQEKDDQVHHGKESGIQEKEEAPALEKTEAHKGEQAKTEKPRKKSKIFAPIVAGSAILLSLVVFAIHVTRTKNQPTKRKD